ncbi:MAG: DUF192 domain-containing protein [Oceanicaulis sp.]|nr:DUF192 domain-containing protein [Oceanicaulis sp.]
MIQIAPAFSRFVGAFTALLILTAACAHADPTAPDAVVVFGGPDRVVVETAEGPVELTVEVAASDEARQRGLMHRESLDPDAGMLFDFQREQIVSIWMENTLIPLDILYIRRDGRIAKIIAHAQPMSRRQLLSDFPVLSVLEINAGRSAELGITPGDIVRHALFGNEVTDEPELAPEADPAAGGGDGEPGEDETGDEPGDEPGDESGEDEPADDGEDDGEDRDSR